MRQSVCTDARNERPPTTGRRYSYDLVSVISPGVRVIRPPRKISPRRVIGVLRFGSAMDHTNFGASKCLFMMQPDPPEVSLLSRIATRIARSALYELVPERKVLI